jgi:hypothetical protein
MFSLLIYFFPVLMAASVDKLIEVTLLASMEFIEKAFGGVLFGILICLLALVHKYRLMERLDKLNDIMREAVDVLSKIEREQYVAREIKNRKQNLE